MCSGNLQDRGEDLKGLSILLLLKLTQNWKPFVHAVGMKTSTVTVDGGGLRACVGRKQAFLESSCP